ncbi:MAG: hypothetical protein CMJ83_16200 [Planctomycetes bacterium]|nr:hypothetical protein [Planctomycetota bacterium]
MTPRALVVVGALAVATAAQTVSVPAEFHGVRAHVQKLVKRGASPAIAIGVLKAGKLVWAEGFGYADLEGPQRATADTVFRLASISKPITATALMLLADRGQVRLDGPANAWLPKTPLVARVGSASAMTLRRLADHTSGLPEHWCFFYDDVTPLTVPQAVSRYGFAAWQPGSRYGYSNLAYGVLGHVVERASKLPYGRFIETAVCDPIGMRRTGEGVRKGLERYAAAPYTRDVAGRFVRVPPYGFDHQGASALHSTVNDLMRFVRMHLGDGAIGDSRVLSPESAVAMRTLSSESSAGRGTGIGWTIAKSFDQDTFGHGGFMPGVSTQLTVFPKERHALVVLLNSDRKVVTEDVGQRIGRALFPNWKPRGMPPTVGSGRSKPDRALIGSWTGVLHHPDRPIEMTLQIEESGASMTFGSSTRVLEHVRLTASGFRGRASTRLATVPGFHGVPMLDLNLERVGRVLQGTAHARANGYFALPHWVRLERK